MNELIDRLYKLMYTIEDFIESTQELNDYEVLELSNQVDELIDNLNI